MKKVSKSAQKRGQPITNRREVQKDQDPTVLPILQDQLAVGFTLRFVTTLNFTGSYTVTWENLLDSWFVAGSATTAYQLFDFVKIRKVSVRGMGSADPGYPLGPTANVGIEFPGLVGGQFGGGKQKEAFGIGSTVPAYVSLKPDPMSQAAQYQPSTSNAAFIFRATDSQGTKLAGAVVDVQVVFRNSADISPAAVATARAGMTSGQLYFGGIDGLLPANTIARSAFIPRA